MQTLSNGWGRLVARFAPQDGRSCSPCLPALLSPARRAAVGSCIQTTKSRFTVVLYFCKALLRARSHCTARCCEAKRPWEQWNLLRNRAMASEAAPGQAGLGRPSVGGHRGGGGKPEAVVNRLSVCTWYCSSLWITLKRLNIGQRPSGILNHC